MPILDPVVGEAVVALFTILYGIVIEKWYVTRDSIFINTITLFVVTFTIDIDTTTLALLVFYVLIGFGLSQTNGYGRLKLLFGSKLFGSLALMLALMHIGTVDNTWNAILVGWMIISFLVMLIGYGYNEYTK